MPDASTQDWTKPAAMAIPKGGFNKDSAVQGRYGPIFPKTPACYGFSILARIIPGREEVFYEYARNIEEAVAGQPDVLAVLKLHYLRWVLFPIKGETYFMYQGIFDTDFDKYTEDAVGIFASSGLNTVFENLEGFPKDWKTNAPAFYSVRPRTSLPEFPRIRRIPVCECGRDQEGAQAQGGVFPHARPDAIGRFNVAEPLRDSTTYNMKESAVLEVEDIQHILLTRAPALTGRYEFLSFRRAASGREWLAAILEKVQSAAAMRASVEKENRWVTVAFTWNGLRALGLDDASLVTFPEEFKQGMVDRAEMLGDTGENHPDRWVGGLASQDLHAIVILFARDAAERARSQAEHEKLVARCEGVEVLSSLDLEATPPFDHAHDHFGYRDRLSQPVIEGSGDEPTPGSGAPLKPGEFILGYPDEEGPAANLPQPEVLARNGSFMAYRRLQEHVARFRDFLRANGKTLRSRNFSRRN